MQKFRPAGFAKLKIYKPTNPLAYRDRSPSKISATPGNLHKLWRESPCLKQLTIFTNKTGFMLQGVRCTKTRDDFDQGEFQLSQRHSLPQNMNQFTINTGVILTLILS